MGFYFLWRGKVRVRFFFKGLLLGFRNKGIKLKVSIEDRGEGGIYGLR